MKENDKCVIQFRKTKDKDIPEIEVTFINCFKVEYLKNKMEELLVEDFALNDFPGMKYIFQLQKYNLDINDYNHFLLFDKKVEKTIETGVIKKSIIDIIFKNYKVSYI
ncbi:hypothetical protein [Urechidicola croceus]|nr:hypothetical protein [Urechidicola croceus]